MHRVRGCDRAEHPYGLVLCLVDAIGATDAVGSAERHLPSDIFHLPARNADVLKVESGRVHGLSARVLEGKQDRLEVAALLVLLVLGMLGHSAAELLELSLKGARGGDS